MAREIPTKKPPQESSQASSQESSQESSQDGLPLDVVLLCILDGWGLGQGDAEKTGDAIRLASRTGKTPVWDALYSTELKSELKTSGAAVGLPKGQMGNSEVGHMHIGAGRVVKQSLLRIDEVIASGEFFNNEGLGAFAKQVRDAGKSVVHVTGIVSEGGVHGSSRHVLATLRFFKERGLCVRLHAFLDGRDSSPRAARETLPRFLEECKKEGLDDDMLASVMGRYYAMDRDMRMERTQRAWHALALGIGERIEKGVRLEQVLTRRYELGESDEFVLPMIFGDYKGFKEGDALFFTNFRDDRTRQLAAACVGERWRSFSRGNNYKLPYPMGSMTPYGAGNGAATSFADFHVAFPKEPLNDTLGECLAKAGLKQLRIAETEKFAHVTYFFNGGWQETFEGEKWHLAPSPKVATYDQEPAMSARQVAGIFSLHFRKENFSLFVVNFANPDMVGHTGKLEAAIEAVEAVDDNLGTIFRAVKFSSRKVGLMIFADHGNAEQMRDEQGAPHTAHTTNPVPLVVTGSPSANLDPSSFRLLNGSLTDIAPTALHLLGLPKPAVMTGRSLLEER